MSDNSNQREENCEENLEDIIDEDEKPNVPTSSSRRSLKTYVKNIFMILLFGIFIFNAYYINEESQRAVETKFGQLIRITGPGLHFKLPFIESYQQYQLSIQQIAPQNIVSTASLDNYELKAKIALLYRLPEEQVEYIHRNIPDFKQLLESLVIKIFKEKIGKINMIDVPTQRGALSKYIINNLKYKIQEINLNIKLDDFSMPYYDWDEAFLTDIQEIEAEKSNTRKAESNCQTSIVAARTVNIETIRKINSAQAGVKVQTIKSQQIDLRIKTIAAHVEAVSKQIMAKCDAAAIKTKGKAQADALKAQAQALVENPRLIELEKIKRWDGKLSDCRIFPFMNQTSTNTLPITLSPPSSVVENPQN